jgi:hypothetical protein
MMTEFFALMYPVAFRAELAATCWADVHSVGLVLSLAVVAQHQSWNAGVFRNDFHRERRFLRADGSLLALVRLKPFTAYPSEHRSAALFVRHNVRDGGSRDIALLFGRERPR